MTAIKAYEQDFLDFRKELHSFVFRLLANRQDAEDVVQETYIKVVEKISTFEGRSSFKTWVFTIALNKARNLLKQQKRWREDTQDIAAGMHMDSPEMTQKVMEVFFRRPDQEFEIREHISYCFNCITKTLDLSQQLCLLLKEVYEFKVGEIMEITGLTEGKVKHALADARQNMIRIFDNRCAFVNKNGICHQCTALKGVLNPQQDAHIKAKEVKLVKEADNPDKEYLLNLRMKLVQEIDPLNASNSHLHNYFLENNPKWVKMKLMEKS